MIAFGTAILPTSCSRAANSRLRRRSASRPSCSPTFERECDDALAVLAGVAVVRLDDVPEHERGAAIGVVELEQALEALAALVREHREQGEQRNEQQHVGGMRRDLARDQVAHAGERGVDPVHPRLGQLRAEARPARDRVAQAGREEVDRELGEQGRQEQRGAGCLGPGARDREHEGGSECEARVPWRARQSRGIDAPLQHVGQHRQHQRDYDPARRQRDRHREHERDERELRRRRVPERGVERDPGRRGEHEHAEDGGERPDHVRRVHRPQHGGPGEEQQRQRRGSASFRAAHACALELERLGQALLLLESGVELHVKSVGFSRASH